LAKIDHWAHLHGQRRPNFEEHPASLHGQRRPNFEEHSASKRIMARAHSPRPVEDLKKIF
jgi:hypothetical protein